MLNLDDVAALPRLHEYTIQPDDLNPLGIMGSGGHLAIFSTAAWRFFASIGLNETYFTTQKKGVFSLTIHLTYHNGVVPGDHISIHARALARSEKRLHWAGIMLNTTQQSITAIIEGIDSHADLVLRRTAPFPPEIAERIDAVIAAHQTLPWQLDVMLAP